MSGKINFRQSIRKKRAKWFATGCPQPTTAARFTAQVNRHRIPLQSHLLHFRNRHVGGKKKVFLSHHKNQRKWGRRDAVRHSLGRIDSHKGMGSIEEKQKNTKIMGRGEGRRRAPLSGDKQRRPSHLDLS